MKFSDVGILIVILDQFGCTERAELSFSGFKSFLCGECVRFDMKIFHIVVVGVCPSEPSCVWVIAVENQRAGKGLAEIVYFPNKGFDFAVSVELIPEEVQNDLCFQMQLRIVNRNMGFICF